MNAQREKEIIITNRILAILVVMGALALGIVVGKQKGWVNRKPLTPPESRIASASPIPLPSPDLKLNIPINQALQSRITRHQFTDQKLNLQQISQLSWALQGITTDWGERTVTTTKASYPLQISLVVKNVENLDSGLYIYNPEHHHLVKIEGYDGKLAEQIFKNTPSFLQAAAVFIISGNYQKMNHEIDEAVRKQIMALEAGSAVQNAFLEAEALGLGANQITEFFPDTNAVLEIPVFEQLFAVIPVGYPMSK